MNVYRVNDIAEKLEVNPETVRRWIRNGKLSSTINTRKEGNIITEDQLEDFLSKRPKTSFGPRPRESLEDRLRRIVREEIKRYFEEES